MIVLYVLLGILAVVIVVGMVLPTEYTVVAHHCGRVDTVSGTFQRSDENGGGACCSREPPYQPIPGPDACPPECTFGLAFVVDCMGD